MIGAPRRPLTVVATAAFIAIGQMVEARAEAAEITAGGSLNPRVLLGAAALLVMGLLILLYFYRRRLYIRYWILGWLLAAAAPFLIAHRFANKQAGDAMFGLSQFVGILSALVFVISADAYRTKPRLRRAYAAVLLPVLIWFTLAPVGMGAVAVYAPGHLMIAGAFAAAGIAHLALMRQTRLLGAAVVGTMMLVFALANGWWAFEEPSSLGLSDRATFLNLALYLSMALGMQLMTFEDMTYELRLTNRRLESAQDELRDLVTRDALTGCRNRRFFDEVIGREIQRHRRYRIPLSLLFIDVDRFKAINDTLGHEAGDRVLQQVAAFLIDNVREADDVFRWGGDEFLILISCPLVQAERKAVELKMDFAHSDGGNLPSGVGLSIGCAEITPEAADIMAVVKIADGKMYQDKRGAAP
jgi:diguanylate cyclase (GGDEF)-like protein